VARYVIAPEVALRLAGDEAAVSDEHRLLAPTLFRSQVLSLLYQAVRRGELGGPAAAYRRSQGQVPAAVTQFEQVLAGQVRVLGEDHPDTLVASNARPAVYTRGMRAATAQVPRLHRRRP